MVLKFVGLALPRDEWKAVYASLVALTLGYSTFVGVTFGLFLRPLSAEFGWTRTEISLGFSIAAGLMIFLAPLAGMAIDKVGARRILLPSSIALGIVICAMSFMDNNIAHFYLMFMFVAIAGMGTLPLGYNRVVVQWFSKKPGLALGVAMSGVGVGAVVLPLLLNHIISQYGWRSAYLCFGLLVFCIAVPVTFFWVREPPKNRDHSDEKISQPTVRFLQDVLRAGQRRLVIFLIISFVLLGLASGGLLAHIASLLVDHGLPLGQTSLMISLLGASLVTGRIGIGKLLDRYFAPRVAFITLTGFAAGLFLLLLPTNIYVYILAVVAIGFGLGAEFDFMGYMANRYFPAANFGSVSGFMYSAFQAGAVLGPLVMGLSYDITSKYTGGLIVLGGGVFCAAILMLNLGAYREQKMRTLVKDQSS
jgi:MFS family permease